MSKTALVVDDSFTMRHLVCGVLKQLGFCVLEAPNGQDALNMLSHPVDLIISDVNMPGMDGITFVRQLRTVARMKATPVLMLTTETDGTVKERAKQAGATGWLTKPFSVDQLSAVVHRVCP